MHNPSDNKARGFISCLLLLKRCIHLFRPKAKAHRFGICLVIGMVGFSLAACQAQNNEKPRRAPVPSKEEVVLAPDSPKRQYIEEVAAELVQRPLMEPVAARIVYDETRTVRVFSPITGRVIGAIAAIGETVRAGDVLAELDSPELGQAQSDYSNALADLSLAERAYQRIKELVDNGIVPRKDLDQAEDNLSHARNEAERARLKLVNLGVRGGRTDNRFLLHAPISGTITERNINPGMEVRPDLAASLFVISGLDQLWVQMDIFEKDIGLIHVNENVLLRVLAYPSETFTAKINYVSKKVDEDTRTVKVRCTLPNAGGRLLPEMYASAEVQSDAGDLAIVVPLTALFTEDESEWVYVNVGDFHYQKRRVKVGLRPKDRAVILEGVKPGERIVVKGALLLRTEQDSEQQSGERM